MTPPPKAARLLFPALRWSEDTGFDHLEPEIARALELGVGGFILFGGEAQPVRGLVDSLRTRSAVPLIIGSDLERGAGQQFRGCTALPPAWALGSLGDLETLWKAGELTAREARALGVDWVYAPVADLGNEPANPIVATRALGADPNAVSRGVSAWILGCLAGGGIPCAKHFPGHGRTLTDSHAELPLVADPVDVLAQDLMPFAAAVAAGVPSVMSAHVAFPALDPERLPATRSAPILQGILRGWLGFEGVVVSDALIMEGAAQGASDEDAAVQAVRAGVDALLYPRDLQGVAQALEGASRDALPPGRLAEAVGRLDRMRRSIGFVQRPVAMSGEGASTERKWGSERDRRWARETALRTVAVLRAPSEALPRLSSLVIVDDDVGGPYPPPSRATFSDALNRLGVHVEVTDAATAASSSADESGTRLVAVFADVRAWKGRVGLSERARAQLRDAVADHGSALVVLFSHPWNAVEVPPQAALLCAWGGEPLMQEAAARTVARLATT